MLLQKIVPTILTQFALPTDGPHGPAHWERVLTNARRLARGRDVNEDVLTLFAVFHDSRRLCEGVDRDHGLRGADYALACRGVLFDLSDPDMDRLHAACAGHDGLDRHHPDETVRICWDAERLDLARLGIRPRAGRMGTRAAGHPSVIDWASRRSLRDLPPGFRPSPRRDCPGTGLRR